MGLYSRAILERIIEETGHSNCHYCKLPTRINYRGGGLDRDHATVDHKVPKSRGGTNAAENLVLACNACNNAKGDRAYEDFVARPYRVKPTVINGKFVRGGYGPALRVKKPAEHPAYKARAGTLAAAIASGAVTEFGLYQGTPPSQLKSEPRNRIKPVPYHETMYILTGKKAPKRSEIFEPRGKKRELTEKEKQEVLSYIYKGREYLLRTG